MTETDPEQYVTQKEFAELEGVSKSEISQRKTRGQLVMKNGRVAVNASRELREKTRHPDRPIMSEYHAEQRNENKVDNEATGLAGTMYQQSRALKEKYNAMQARIAYEKEIGQLIDVAAAKIAVMDGDAAIRNRLESMPDILAPQLAVETDEHKIRAILIDQIEILLSDISKTFYRMVNDE